MIIAPSVLSADFLNLERDIQMINNSNADWFHVDIMDGVYVPNISFGMPVMSALQKAAKKPLDVHLMLINPDLYIDEFAKLGASILTVHYEACTHLHRTIQRIKQAGCKAGVALNPHTPVHVLSEIIGDLDLVLIMSVNPGFGGQKFIPNTLSKCRELKQLITAKGANAIIEVDGGVTLENAPELLRAGVGALVAGNTVFASPNPTDTIDKLKKVDVSTLV
jgi:ribulose-phosphate 3-epimerase